jgi:hypothetical protein
MREPRGHILELERTWLYILGIEIHRIEQISDDARKVMVRAVELRSPASNTALPFAMARPS